jgi:predicted DNA-binding protein with PD1-like motif
MRAAKPEKKNMQYAKITVTEPIHILSLNGSLYVHGLIID